jgi:hypothetical protein
LEQQWEQRHEWVLCYRKGLPIHRHNTNNFAEATNRIVKDVILSLQRSFNMIAFIEHFIGGFEKYLKYKILSMVVPLLPWAAGGTGMV